MCVCVLCMGGECRCVCVLCMGGECRCVYMLECGEKVCVRLSVEGEPEEKESFL